MTTTARPRYSPRGYRDRTIIATPAEIAAAIYRHSTDGTFIAAGTPQPIGPADRRYRVTIRVGNAAHAVIFARHDRVIRSRQQTRGRLVQRFATSAGITFGAIVGVAAVAAYLVGQLVELYTRHAPAILAARIAVALAGTLLLRLRRPQR